MTREREEAKSGLCSYTLFQTTSGTDTVYSLAGTSCNNEREDLFSFTHDREVAKQYLAVLTANEVSPLHIRDLWEDSNA